jgi:hypothetical protein
VFPVSVETSFPAFLEISHKTAWVYPTAIFTCLRMGKLWQDDQCIHTDKIFRGDVKSKAVPLWLQHYRHSIFGAVAVFIDKTGIFRLKPAARTEYSKHHYE